VTEDLLCFTQPPHNTWLYICYGYTAKLSSSLHTPVSELSSSYPVSECPLTILKTGLTVESSIQGVYLLWTRYFDYLEEQLCDKGPSLACEQDTRLACDTRPSLACELDTGLADVLVSDMVHCLKTVPTLHEGDYSFHNAVIVRLLSHVPEECRTEHLHKLSSILPDNAELIIRCAHQEAKSNPLSAVLTLREYLLSHPSDARLWIMAIKMSLTCQPTSETRGLATEALSHNPLHSSLLKQVFLFELAAAHEAVQKKQLAKWAFDYSTEKGIQLKIR